MADKTIPCTNYIRSVFRAQFVRFIARQVKSIAFAIFRVNGLRIKGMTTNKVLPMKKQVTDKQRHAKKNKVKRVTVRFTESEMASIAKNAAAAHLSLATIIRKGVLGLPIVSRVDQHAIVELRRLGSMLKHLYPKEANWTVAEKRQYWKAMHTILGVAKDLSGKDSKAIQTTISNLGQEPPDVS